MLKFIIIIYIIALIDLALTPIEEYDGETIFANIFGPLLLITLPFYIYDIIEYLERIFKKVFAKNKNPYNYKDYLNRLKKEKSFCDYKIVPITYNRWITFYNLNPSSYSLGENSGLIYFIPEDSTIKFIFEFNKKDYKKAIKYLLKEKNRKSKINENSKEYKDILKYLDFVKRDIQKNNELSNEYYKMAEMKINEIKANMDIY